MSIDYREIYKLLKERPAGFEERINFMNSNGEIVVVG